MTVTSPDGSAYSARRCGPHDVPELVQLMYEFYAESSYALDRGWASRAFERVIAEPALGAVWVVERDGVAAGYVVLTVHFAMEFGGLCGTIDDLFVRPAHRRRGAGSLALGAVLDECRRRGCGAVSVTVGTDNEAARLLYRKYGMTRSDDGRIVLTGTV